MPTKSDVEKFAQLVKTNVADTLKNLTEYDVKLTQKMEIDIYMKIFEIVEETVRQVDLKASNELVNCIVQNLYLSVEVNGRPLSEDIISQLIDPLKLPDNERPFIYAFFAKD